MYLVDFFKSLFKKSNLGELIWMIVNTILICSAFGALGYFMVDETIGMAFAFAGIGFVAYFLSIVIALSPFGEWILRFQTGCRKLEDPEILERIQPLFDHAYARAKLLDPGLSDKIKLYINYSKDPNAFACGRNTVCITQGLLAMSDYDILGILGHEFGHLAHKDTDRNQVIIVGNLIVSVIFFLIRIFVKVSVFFTRVMFQFTLGLVTRSLAAHLITWITGALTRLIIDGLLALLMVCWTKLGVWICMATSRADEYLADEYSYRLGYGILLRNALKKLDGNHVKTHDAWAALSSSHPPTPDRVAKLNILLHNEK